MVNKNQLRIDFTPDTPSAGGDMIDLMSPAQREEFRERMDSPAANQMNRLQIVEEITGRTAVDEALRDMPAAEPEKKPPKANHETPTRKIDRRTLSRAARNSADKKVPDIWPYNAIRR